jgi:hypothetical protein
VALFVVAYRSEDGAVVTYHSEGGAVCCYVLLRGWRCLLLRITQRVAQFVVANVSWRRFSSVLLTCFPLE